MKIQTNICLNCENNPAQYCVGCVDEKTTKLKAEIRQWSDQCVYRDKIIKLWDDYDKLALAEKVEQLERELKASREANIKLFETKGELVERYSKALRGIATHCLFHKECKGHIVHNIALEALQDKPEEG